MLKRIKELISKTNPELDLTKIDFKAHFDSTLTFEENLDILKKEYPAIELHSEDTIINIDEQAEEFLLKNLTEHPTLNVEKTHKYINDFCLHCSHITYSTLFALINPSVVINYGGAGLGKSRSSVELAKSLGVPKVVVISGYITYAGFRRILKKYNNYTIIFDDADTILENKNIYRALKSFLTTRKIYYITNKGIQEDNFYGSLIINVNEYKFGKFIEDKVIMNNVVLTSKEIKEKITSDFKEVKEVKEMILNRIIYSRNNKIKLNQTEKNLIISYVLSLPYVKSVRYIERYGDILLGLKQLYGSITPKVLEIGKELFNRYIHVDDIMAFILSKSEINSKELVELIAQTRSVSTRQARNNIKKMIDEGLLVKKNRNTLVSVVR